MESSEDQRSVSEHGVAGRVCPSSQEYKKPPRLSFKLKKAGDVPKSTETWNDDHLPIDILLLTVESCGFLSCFSFLDQPFKSYKFGIGYVYFGHMGDASDQEKLKVALMTCSKGSATPGSSLTVLLNALRVLRPKAVFSVGTCISLSLENVRMGDVVISSKLTTAEGYRSSACRLFVSLVQDAPCGWVAPLANPDELKVKVHCNGDILIQSLEKKCQYDDIYEKYPGAVAIETDGRGVNASACDANIKWVAVKGVASYFLQSHSATAEWMCFASTMAASVVAKMLNDPTVFREWPHYNQADDANTELVEMKQVASYSDPSQSATSKRMSFTTTVAASLGAKMINAQTFFWKWQQLNQGLYAAAYDANIEWVIVKGVASYFHERKSVTHEWMSFASTMAASVVAKMLNDPTVVQEWWHYNQVAGGKKKELCLPSPEYKKPPQHSFKLKKGGGVPKSTETWGNDHLRIDILLLAMESSDFVSCLSFLDKRFKSYKMGIGYLYFGCMGDVTDPEKLKIALMYFPKVAALTAGSSLAVVVNAVRVLRPKAAFSGGTCISLDLKKFRMGDVVISLKLTAEGFRTPVGPFLGSLIQDAPHGWVAPLENLDEFQVKVHWDGKILSLSLREKGPCDDICKQYPGAVVIETEGVDAATHDANIDWVAVKGVASYFCRSQSATSGWMSFASTMDAAVVTKMLYDLTVFREWPHNNQVTPLEIYWRGPRALEAYYKALDEGQMRVRRIPLMLIGQARSGKTSLKKSLKGVPFNPNEDSTVQIDADPSYFKVTTETWKIGEKDQDTNKEATSYFEFNLEGQMLKWIKQDVNLPKTETEAQSVSVRNEVTRDPTDITSRIFDQEASSLHSLARTHSKAGKDDNHAFQSMCKYKSCPEKTIERDDPLSLQETFKEIESSLSDLLAVDELESEDDIYSVLWDFSGESVYYETHSLFLTSRAIYLLAYDLSLDPYERAQAVKRQEMFRVSEDRVGTKTNLDYLDYWMTSVSSVSSSGGKDHDVLPASESTVLPKRIPPVFLVCTNADRPFGGKDPKDLALKVYDELLKKPYNTHLWGQYEVDNNKSNQKRECLGVSRLREKIREVAKELPQMKEFIPIKWLKFEKILDVFLCKGHKWITIERAKQIANDLCQIHDDEEFKTALGFLHDQRILFHLENAENVSQFVFLDPQWLIDVMKKVITIKRYDDGEKEFLGLWRKLQEEGILEEKLLKHVWGPLIGEDAVFESLIKIMEKFSLLCTWPSSDDLSGRKYLVPSILTTYPPQDITKLISSARVPSLFIKFESGQVPSRLFPRLVTQFLLWGKDGFWSSENPPLYQNLARLYTAKDDNCSVVFLCHSSFIEVVVHGDNDSFKVSCAQSVLGQLLFILKRMRTELFWLKRMRYQAGVVCTVCCGGRKVKFCHKHRRNDCEREECLHFIPESELRSADESITCTRSPTLVYNKICIEDFSLWFGSCQKDSSFSSASVPHLQKAPKGCSMSTFSRKLKVTLLASEWGSSKGGLSTITRELAIQLARNDYVEVCMYLPLFSDKDKEAAADLRVCLLKAKEKHGYDDPIDWLISIPRNQQMDIVIGHGIHLGRQVPHLKEPHPECKWIQVVHTDPKELGMLKTDADPTATGTKKHEAEVKLCQEADQVVAIGPKLADTYSHFCGTGKVLVLTPGIFSEFTDINQDTQERTVFHVLVFGCGESEDFHLKGYDIAARAVAELKDEEPLFKLVFVGAPSGKEEQIKQMLLKEGILAPQLIVRSAKEREQLALQFHEADLVIMPSRSNDFGLAALEALSAGLPVLVSRTSGLGEALKEVPYGKNFVLNSEDPTEWAKEIKAIKSERREVRLKKAIRLREKYAMKYQWEKQCRRLVERMREIVKS